VSNRKEARLRARERAGRTAIVVYAISALALTLGSPAPASAASPESPTTYVPAAVLPTAAFLHGVLDETASSFPVEPGTYEFLYKATSGATVAECESPGASKAPVPSGNYFGVEPEPVFQEINGLTPNTEYVVCLAAENGSGERTVGNAVGFATTPEVPQTEPATEIEATSARLNGSLEPPGTELEYEFIYHRGSFCTGGSATKPAQGEGTVSTVVEGLAPATNYTFCLVARGPGGQTRGPGQTFETPVAAPAVKAEFASAVGANSATLNATINPDGLATTYRFEYGPTAAYGSTAPAPEGHAGSGVADVTVSLLVQGLSPGLTYHYRVVAINSLGATEGADRTFTTRAGEASGLIDGRGWELVSPPDKRGAALEAITLEGGAIQAAEDGSGLSYIAKAPVDANPAGNRSFAEQQLLATRGGGGWSTADIATPHEAVAGLHSGELSEYRLFSPNLSSGVVEPSGATPLSPAASERTPYLRTASGEYLPLVTGCPPPGEPCPTAIHEHENVPPGTKFGANEDKGKLLPETGVQFRAATPDLAHLLLSAHQPLAAGFATGELQALYEWNAGALEPVSILPGGASAATEGGAYPGSAQGVAVNARHAISVNGDRIFFGTPELRRLFARDTAQGQSVRLDAPEEGIADTFQPAQYQDASRDGTRIFFTDTAPLTTNATATNNERDLYMCELPIFADDRSCAEKGGLKDLTIGNSGIPADVLGAVIGTSEDGSSVYFVANGVLSNGAVPVAGATAGDCNVLGSEEERTSQSCNLYDWHEGQVRLVAVLSGNDFPDWEANDTVHTDLTQLTARVAPNGRFLAFMSQRPLTDYDNHDAVSGALDEEVFLYDSASGKLVCASCDPSGARPAGVHDPIAEEEPPLLIDRVNVWGSHWLAASIPGWTPAAISVGLYQSRYLSNEGQLFFNSAVGLLPGDTNGTQDVYEFEPNGTGGCTSTTSSSSATFVGEVVGTAVDGCIGLISSGTSAEESAFLDASGMGPGGHEAEDVFFLSPAKLATLDVDDALDVYDAHVCSSLLPCLSASASEVSPCSEADTCRGGVAPQPGIFGAPATATSPSTGNLSPPAAKPTAKTPAQIRAATLAKALKACKRKHVRRQRIACERTARKKYGPAKARKQSRKHARGGKGKRR
jgi:hypothetical protein